LRIGSLRGPTRCRSIRFSKSLLIGVLRFLLDPDFSLDLKPLETPLHAVRSVLFLQNLSRMRAELLKGSTLTGPLTGLEQKRLTILGRWLAEGRLNLISDPPAPVGFIEDQQLQNATDVPSVGRCYRVSGWARNPKGAGPAEEVVLLARQGRRSEILAVCVPEHERVDVALGTGDTNLLYAGWVSEFQIDSLSSAIEGTAKLEAYALDSRFREAHKLIGEQSIFLPEREVQGATTRTMTPWLSKTRSLFAHIWRRLARGTARSEIKARERDRFSC
jgi:hypothetical protein